MAEDPQRIIRNYDISTGLYEWLRDKAERERRPVIKQVEVILEAARDQDIRHDRS